jgi:hypothetical protein
MPVVPADASVSTAAKWSLKFNGFLNLPVFEDQKSQKGGGEDHGCHASD